MGMPIKFVFILILAVLIPGAWAQTWEISGAFTGYFPQDSLWQGQVQGQDVQLAYWTADRRLGLALNTGQTSWDVDSQVVRHTNAVTDSLSGQTDFRYVGLSLLTSTEIPESPWFRMSLEAGLAYVTCDTDMRIAHTLDLGGGMTDTESFNLTEQDNHAWVARIAAGVKLSPNERGSLIKFFAKVGYQFDLDPATVVESTWLGYQQDLHLSGGFVQLGAIIAIP